MERKDLPRVMEIERECFPVPWSENAYLTEIHNRSAYYVVACSENLVVGYAGMWLVMDEAHITTLGVARSHRRQRIAEQLLINLLDEAMHRGARRATLEVRESNLAAQSLYKKFEFTPVAIRRGYYTDNREDALVMWIEDLRSPKFSSKYRALKQKLAEELAKFHSEERTC
jgi:ribosomal-protein-alanine N-acetyltransferase